MKITNIHIPEMAQQYMGCLDMQSIAEKFSEAFIKVEEDRLTVYMKDDPYIGDIMRLIKEKTEPITIGNGKFRAYEYELGYTENTGHIFLIAVEGKDYYCTLDSLYHSENGDLHIEFRII
jgi:hypothetical protein